MENPVSVPQLIKSMMIKLTSARTGAMIIKDGVITSVNVSITTFIGIKDVEDVQIIQ